MLNIFVIKFKNIMSKRRKILYIVCYKDQILLSLNEILYYLLNIKSLLISISFHTQFIYKFVIFYVHNIKLFLNSHRSVNLSANEFSSIFLIGIKSESALTRTILLFNKTRPTGLLPGYLLFG